MSSPTVHCISANNQQNESFYFKEYMQNNKNQSNNSPSSSHNNNNNNNNNKAPIKKPIIYTNKRVFKVIMLGDAGVGKTCLSFRFCNGRFPAHTEATVGVDFRERIFLIDNEHIRVQLWDTAGQERFRQSMVTHYYRNVNAVVFVYDMTNRKSFENLPVWIKEWRKNALTASKDTPHILVGNKCDMRDKAMVQTDEAQILADQNDMPCFETSALADCEADHLESILLTLVHKLKESKPMHVQTELEREQTADTLLLRAADTANLFADQSSQACC